MTSVSKPVKRKYLLWRMNSIMCNDFIYFNRVLKVLGNFIGLNEIKVSWNIKNQSEIIMS